MMVVGKHMGSGRQNVKVADSTPATPGQLSHLAAALFLKTVFSGVSLISGIRCKIKKGNSSSDSSISSNAGSNCMGGLIQTDFMTHFNWAVFDVLVGANEQKLLGPR